jgi:hypothetical protein
MGLAKMLVNDSGMSCRGDENDDPSVHRQAFSGAGARLERLLRLQS